MLLPTRAKHLVQVKLQIKSSFQVHGQRGCRLGTARARSPARRPPPCPPHSGLTFSLDIVLENGSHATNTPGLFQLHIFYGGISASLPASKTLESQRLMENKRTKRLRMEARCFIND